MRRSACPHCGCEEIGLEETQRALSDALGPGYQVNSVVGSALKVKRNSALWATVHPIWSGGVTTFRVTSGGFILGRAVNAVAVTRKAHSALAQAFPESAGARRER